MVPTASLEDLPKITFLPIVPLSIKAAGEDHPVREPYPDLRWNIFLCLPKTGSEFSCLHRQWKFNRLSPPPFVPIVSAKHELLLPSGLNLGKEIDQAALWCWR